MNKNDESIPKGFIIHTMPNLMDSPSLASMYIITLASLIALFLDTTT